MTPAGHPLRWLPPFIVGVCAATAAEVAVGILLYGGPGLMRSLTTVLAVEAGALGVGLLSRATVGSELVESLRRRWLLVMVAFLGATVFAAVWTFVDRMGGAAVGQGLGLALLAALPLYSVGALLSAMARVVDGEPGEAVPGVGGPAALGAALGFAATGASLTQVFTPASLLLVCVVMLSAGGLVFGSVLDAWVRVRVLARRPSPFGEVTVEERHLLARDEAARILLEGEFVRSWRSLAAGAGEEWDSWAFEGLLDGQAPSASILLLGGGASSLPARAIARVQARVVMVERSREVLDLAREHLGTGVPEGAEALLTLRVGNPEDAVADCQGPYALVLVDTAALAPVGGVTALSVRQREALAGCVDPGGVVVFGPHALAGDGWTFPETWTARRYARALPAGLSGLGVCLILEEEILAGSPDPAFPWPDRLGPFRSVPESAP